jgi:predicted ATPase/DNA-binding XRE family transcriptional regulator/Tfp pilus assembly protein PilF
MTNETSSLIPGFGRRLKRLRAQQDMTQERLAELAYCSVQAIRAFETGKRRPSWEMAERLADVLQVPDDQREEFIRQARAAVTAPEDQIKETAPPAGIEQPQHEPAAPAAGALRAQGAPRLPTPPTELIGRQAELAVLHQLLDERRRLITLVGPGGIGKTRLALQLAHECARRFPGGVAFVPLAAVATAAGIPAAIADALGATLSGASDPADQLVALLHERSLLLVLDNFEHLLVSDRAAESIELIEQILQQTHGVQLLVTSRERLRLLAEHSFALTGLAVPVAGASTASVHSDAVMLFLARTQQTGGDVHFSPHDLAAVARICTLLEGIPLAIELAAAWVRVLTINEIATEVARSIDFLALASRGAPERHRSLRAVFEHSWTLLTEEERGVLARLAVFRGGFDRTAASQVAGASLPLLAALVDKSLVQTASAGDAALRYEIHELLGQYLREKLREAGEEQTLVQRHAGYFVALAEQLGSQLYTSEAARFQRLLETELGNLLAALQWGLTEGHDLLAGMRLAGALGRFWYLSGRWKEGRDWLQLAQSQAVDGGAARARVLVTLGEFYCLHGELARSHGCLQESLARWRALQDAPNIAWTLFQLGNVYTARGEHPEAEAAFVESLAIYRSLQDRWGMATVLNQLGSLAINRGDYRRAVVWLDESLPILRTLQRQGGIAVTLNLLGRALLDEGETKRAIDLFEEALAIVQQRNSQDGIAWTQLNLGLAHVQAGQPVEAAAHLRAALRIYQELDSKGGLIAVFAGLAATEAAQTRFVRAAQLLAAADRLRGETGQALTLFEIELINQTQARCKAALSTQAWDSAWTGGAYLSVEQAVCLSMS